jgi:Ser/Thr protein kinase RdoA (MazF antagonist)
VTSATGRTTEALAELLEPLARRALESYDLDVAGQSLITNDFNCVFRLALRDGSRRVLRVSLPNRRTHAEVEGEMDWLAALADGSVPTPSPVRARSGALVVDAATTAVPESRMCTVFEWIEGERLADQMTTANVAALGEAAAHLHQQAATFPAPAGMRTWDSPEPFLAEELSLRDGFAAIVDPDSRALLARARLATIEAIERLRAVEEPRMIHADLHEDNAFVRPDGRIAILDFDDCLLGWPVQDLGVTIWALTVHERFEELEKALRQGYERVAPWPEREPGDVRLFGASRSLLMANYALHDRHPAHRSRAGEMIREEAATIERLLPG